MANLSGKQIAITTISPMKPWKTFFLQLVVFLRGLGVGKENTQNLLELSFIHFARWAIVKRDKFPHLGEEQPVEDLAYDYLFFCSNFNGTWEEYIDAFSFILPGGMDRIWKWSVNYPGSAPITPFKKYIQANQVDTDHYYTAYPGAATNDVKRALQLDTALRDFADKTSDLAGDDFANSYARFLAEMGGNLQTTGPIDHGE